MNSRRILIVEDETIVALDMRIRLEALGYQVIGLADCAEDALSLLDSSKPDLILMDIKLKGTEDGIDLARMIRGRIEVPVIFVTAFTDEQTLERAKLASPYGYIIKPFHERELRISIELALYKFEYELSMRKARDLAEETSRLKSEFLANMSHELKTPLNSVIGFTELAADSAVDDEQREYLDLALKSARSLVRLIDSILEFARLESGKLSGKAEDFSIDALLEECVDLYSVAAHAKGLEARYRRSPRLPLMARGHADAIRSVIQSLTENAVKFTEAGYVGLAAEYLPSENKSPGFILSVVVEDSGIGMDLQRVEDAFDRFKQLDGSRTRAAGGTGLGLAIVRKSLELLGGAVSLDSEPGKGTRFLVQIPLEPARSPLTEEQQSRCRLPARFRRIVLVGFPGADTETAFSSLACLGLPIAALGDLESAGRAASDEDIVIIDEAALERDVEIARRLGDSLVIAYRFGGKLRSMAAREGLRSILLPLRPGALARSLETVRPTVAGVPAPAGGSVSSRALERIPAAPEPRHAELRGPADELLSGFLLELKTAMEGEDYARVERAAKDYDRLFEGLEGCDFGRIAFSALLMARKGDKNGLENLMDKAGAVLGCV